MAGGAEESASPPAAPSSTAAPAPSPVTLETYRAACPADVALNDKGADAMCWACYAGVLPADEHGNFCPDALVDRGGMTTTLLRLSGEEAPAYGGQFPDVGEEDACAPAVAWAVENGLIGGGLDGNFQPNDLITRGQLAILLMRYAALQGWDTSQAGDLKAYHDWEDVADGLWDALSWADGSGVFRGILGSYVLPDFPVSRWQLAEVLACLASLSDTADPALARVAARCWSPAARGVSFIRYDQIQAKMDEIAEEYGAVGIQVSVIERGQLCACLAGGWATKPSGASYADAADVSTPSAAGTTLVKYAGGDPMTVDHKLRCASISKVVLGMEAMALAEEDVVDLDGSIGEYWDCEVKNASWPAETVSLASILSHTSTLPILGDNVSFDLKSVRERLSQGTAGGRPGHISAWGYNNYAFGVLGMTLELAAGEMTDDILNEQFFGALDIDAAFRSQTIEAQDKLTNLYRAGQIERSIERQNTVGALSTAPGSYGGLFSGGLTISARDLAKMTAILAGDGLYNGVRFLSEDSVARMEKPLGVTAEGFTQCYPLRLREVMYGREKLYYHTGSAWGVYNCMSYDPDTGDGVVVFTSGASGERDEYGVYAVCGEISSYIYSILT